MFVDYETIYNFVAGSEYFSLEEIESYRDKVSDYIETNYADVYVGDSYYQEELSHLNYIEDVIFEYDYYVNLYYSDELVD